MLKSVTFLFLMILLAVSLTYADNKSTEVKTIEVQGTIDKIDVDGKTITVQVEGTPHVYTFDEATVFGTQEMAFKVDELKAGETILLKVDDSKKVFVVTRVEPDRQ